MNCVKRLCGKGGDAQVYKGEPYLAFGNLQQAVPIPPQAKRWPLGACMLTVPVRIVACSIVSEDGPVEVVLGAPLGGIPLQISVRIRINKWRSWWGIHALSFTFINLGNLYLTSHSFL